MITGPERRRRWTDEQKRAIVAASLEPGAAVADVARRAEIRPDQIYRWRPELAQRDGVAISGYATIMEVTGQSIENRTITAGAQCDQRCDKPDTG